MKYNAPPFLNTPPNISKYSPKYFGVNHFAFLNEKKLFEYTAAEMELIFVELPKFNKSLEELDTLVDKWIYFIKKTDSLELIPESLAEVSAIEKALNIANKINLSPEELELLEQRAIMAQDESDKILFAEQKGANSLIIRQLKKRLGEVPENLKNQLPDLSLEELENLSEEIFDFTTFDDLSNWLANR